ncbi:unnamed protein product [Boreogadus saida]
MGRLGRCKEPAHTRTDTFRHTHTHTYRDTVTHTHSDTHTHTRRDTVTHIGTQSHTHTHTHTHTQTDTHCYVLTPLWVNKMLSCSGSRLSSGGSVCEDVLPGASWKEHNRWCSDGVKWILGEGCLGRRTMSRSVRQEGGCVSLCPSSWLLYRIK